VSGDKDLRDAIIASPDDDAPRLVYADWLLERGDPRGEFIQIQCALGHTLHGAKGIIYVSDKDAKNPPTREELEKRESALLNKHQKDWLQPIRRYIRTWEWKRGFVDRVEADGATFIAGAGTVFSETPLSHAELTGLKAAHFPLFAKEPAFRTLRSLSLARQRIGPKTAMVFLSPHWCGLRSLDIWGNPLTSVGVATLASAKHFDALKTLDVAKTDMKLAGLEALTKAEFFPRLEHLNLDVGYDADGSRAMGPAAGAALLRGTSLVSLSLIGCGLGDEGLKAIVTSSALPNLESIHLSGNDITEEGAMALAKSKHLQKLHTVKGLLGYEISGLEDGSKGAKALLERFGDGAR
jgi:uncharacterized protein (TIGR02996 family)